MKRHKNPKERTPHDAAERDRDRDRRSIDQYATHSTQPRRDSHGGTSIRELGIPRYGRDFEDESLGSDERNNQRRSEDILKARDWSERDQTDYGYDSQSEDDPRTQLLRSRDRWDYSEYRNARDRRNPDSGPDNDNYAGKNFGGGSYGGSTYEHSMYGGNPSERSSDQRNTSGAGSNDIAGENWRRTSGTGQWNTPQGLQGIQDFRGYQGNQNDEGPYRGKGPKGYERSDERLKEIICEQLTDAPHIDASNITVEIRGGEVTLTGSIENRRMKFAAEELIEKIGCITEINNQLKVASRTRFSEQQTTQGAPYNQKGADQ